MPYDGPTREFRALDIDPAAAMGAADLDEHVPMRILINALNFAPEPTGSGKYTGEMAAWLADRGHEVHAIAAPPHYPMWRLDAAYRGRGVHTEEWRGVKVHRAPVCVPPPSRVTVPRRILLESSFNATALAHWLPTLVGRRFDVCIAVCPPLQDGVMPALYNAMRGVPWLFHIQDLQVDAAHRLGMTSTLRWARMLPAVEAFLLSRATRVSTISEAMRYRIIDKGVASDRVLLLPNWANLELVVPWVGHNQFREELGATAGATVVMYAGAVGEKQGLNMMVELADSLRSDPRFIFAIVGDGSAAARLRSQAEYRGLSNLHFRAVQPTARLSEVLGSADIQLVLQRQDAADLVLPSKLTNILAAGRPFVATAAAETELGRVTEMCGAGMRVDGPAGLTRAITRLADDPTRRAVMGANARDYAQKNLDISSVLLPLEKMLLNLVANARIRHPA